MRKPSLFALWTLPGLFGLSLAAWAQTPQPPGSAIAGLTQVGVAAAVRGGVEITTPGAVGRVVQSGQAVYLGDTVKTDAQGTLQILLLDETVFTIGPNSALVIDEFVYDPSNDAGEVTAHITQGVFRFVTGKIAKKNPEKMKVNLPSGTIGIRGTMVAGRVEGSRSSVILLGPGPQNSTGAPIGSIVVSNTVGSTVQQVSVVRPGFGTTIEGPGQPPLPPAAVPQSELNALISALGPMPGGGPQGPPDGQSPPAQGQNPGQPAQGPGQPGGPPPGHGPNGPPPPGGFQNGLGPPPPGPPGAFHPMLPPLPPPINQAAQDAAKQTQQIVNSIAKMDQLRSIQTGLFHYVVDHPLRFHQTAPVDRFGFIHANIDINFGSRTVGGGNSNVHVKTIGTSSIDQTITFPAIPFGTGTQDAVFMQTASGLTAKVTIKNADGQIGQRMQLETNFTGSGGRVGSGVSDDVPRTPGPSP